MANKKCIGPFPYDSETECGGGIGYWMADAETGNGYFEGFTRGVEGEDVKSSR
jgi:hypothetical protein